MTGNAGEAGGGGGPSAHPFPAPPPRAPLAVRAEAPRALPFQRPGSAATRKVPIKCLLRESRRHSSPGRAWGRPVFFPKQHRREAEGAGGALPTGPGRGARAPGREGGGPREHEASPPLWLERLRCQCLFSLRRHLSGATRTAGPGRDPPLSRKLCGHNVQPEAEEGRSAPRTQPRTGEPQPPRRGPRHPETSMLVPCRGMA